MAGDPPTITHGPALTGRLLGYIAGLAVAAVLLAASAHVVDVRPPGQPADLALPVLAALLVAAEHLRVRFRHGGVVEALNLVEAVLAPLLFAFPTTVVMATVAGTQLVGGVIRGLAAVKVAFNIAQWSLAAGVGSVLISALSGPGDGLSLRTAAVVLVGLAVVTLVNSTAFAVVLALAENRRPLRTGFSPVFGAGWGAALAINALLGLLLISAYAGQPASVVLFAVPLVVLHVAYRGYAAARSDRTRLSGLRQAATALASPLDPRDAIGEYLEAVLDCFEASAAELVLRTDGDVEVHRLTAETRGRAPAYERLSPERGERLEVAALAVHTAQRGQVGDRGPLGTALARTRWHDCIAAPLTEGGELVGAVLVLDQAGLEAVTTAAELAVADTLARETASALGKGRLLERVLEERRRFAEIVSSTSDGILTLSADGTVLSWNPALERITGRTAEQVVGRPGALDGLALRGTDGRPVDLARWGQIDLPTEVHIDDAHGRVRRLTCSYSSAQDDATGTGAATLVVVARDVTAVDELQQLTEQFHRLAEAEAAQRLVVEHLQSAVTPPRPVVRGVELGVAYVPSESWAPTGGDLYDWLVLPDGDLHVAVVDVLGHGVAATKDALAVVHALRLVCVEGTPVEEVVARADRLLSAQNPDLVATVVVARYEPLTGRLRVASGGHPPALVVSPDGAVRQVAASGGAVGWPNAGSDAVATLQLGPGDTLVLYTDGLVEAHKDLVRGIELLETTAAGATALEADALAGHLVDRSLAGAQRRDDTLALVLRRSPVDAATTARWELRPAPAEVSRSRRELLAWLAPDGAGGAAVDADEVALVATELLSNAVRAARTAVTMTATRLPTGLELTVTDDGAGSESLVRGEVGVGAADTLAEGGRGLFLVHALSSSVDVTSSGAGTTVRCLLAARGPSPDGPGDAGDMTTFGG